MWNRSHRAERPLDPEIYVRVVLLNLELEREGDGWLRVWEAEATRVRSAPSSDDRERSYAVLSLVHANRTGGTAFRPPPEWKPQPSAELATSQGPTGILSLLPLILKFIR